MKKTSILTFFALIISFYCYAQNNNNINYIMTNVEPIIKKHIDRIDLLNDRLKRLDKLEHHEENNIYIYITNNPNSQKLYLYTSKSNYLGDKSNRHLIVGKNSYPIIFDFDYQYATFSSFDSIGEYGHRDGTYLKKTLIIENSPIIYKKFSFNNIAEIINNGDAGLYSLESKFEEINKLNELKYSTSNDTIFVKVTHHDEQAINIQAWSNCDKINIDENSNVTHINEVNLIPIEQELIDQWNSTQMPSIFAEYSHTALAKNQTTYYQIIIQNNTATLSHFKF